MFAILAVLMLLVVFALLRATYVAYALLAAAAVILLLFALPIEPLWWLVLIAGFIFVVKTTVNTGIAIATIALLATAFVAFVHVAGADGIDVRQPVTRSEAGDYDFRWPLAIEGLRISVPDWLASNAPPPKAEPVTPETSEPTATSTPSPTRTPRPTATPEPTATSTPPVITLPDTGTGMPTPTEIPVDLTGE